MPSKILWSSRGLFGQHARSVIWIGIMYTLLLFLSLPLHLMSITEKTMKILPLNIIAEQKENLFALSGLDLLFILYSTIPILLGIFLFSYIHEKKQVEYTHSLPIKRESLFHKQLLLGMILLIVPVLITTIELFIVKNFSALHYTSTAIWQWAGATIVITVAFFMVTVFIGMFTGGMILHGAFTYFLFIFPSLVVITFSESMSFVHGFNKMIYTGSFSENLIPFIKITRLHFSQTFITNNYLLFASFIILFYVCSFIAYKKYPTESATEAISFKVVRPIVRYILTFTFMLVFGMVFSDSEQAFSTMIGYTIGSVLGFVVAEMILEKQWRIWEAWKQWRKFIEYGIVMIIIGVAGYFYIQHFENNVPELSNIQEVYVSEGYNYTSEIVGITYENRYIDGIILSNTIGITPGENPIDTFFNYSSNYFMKEEKNINSVRALHEKIISETYVNNPNRQVHQVDMIYRLKDGSSLKRNYKISDKLYAELEPIYESTEFKKLAEPLLRLKDVSKVKQIRIELHNSGSTSNERSGNDINVIENGRSNYFTLNKSQQIKEFTAVLQEEILRRQVNLSVDTVPSKGSITFYLDGSNIQPNTVWFPSYTKLNKWLTTNKKNLEGSESH